MNQKGLAPILIILVLAGIVAIAVGAYYYGRITSPKNDFFDQNPMVFPSQQPQLTDKPAPDTSTRTSTTDETANWKTYTNNQYSFYFKYPTSLNTEINDYGSKLNVSLKKDLKDAYVQFDFYAELNSDKYKNFDLDQTITINSIEWNVIYPGKSCGDSNQCGQTIPTYWTTKNNFTYTFLYILKEDEETLLKILKTFKFLK